MTDETTPRQVLYALVSAAFHGVVGFLVVAAAVVGLTPSWWSIVTGTAVVSSGIWSVRNWRRTGPMLATAVGLFVIWTVGTLLVT